MNHTIRHRDGGTVEIEDYTYLKAIHAFCTECFGWKMNEVETCTAPTCPLFPYRDTFYASISRRVALEATEEQREKARQRMIALHRHEAGENNDDGT